MINSFIICLIIQMEFNDEMLVHVSKRDSLD